MPPATVLITGFGPFPDTPVNASGPLARRLASVARQHFAGTRIVSSVLPTEWTAAPRRLADLYTRHDPELALHFGVSARVTGLEIERIALNRCALVPDAAGTLPAAGHLVADGPADVRATLPVERILARLSAIGVPATHSDDAGSYLCNALLYHSVCHAGRRPRCISGFVHIPSGLAGTAEPPAALTLDTAIAGGLEMIAVCLDALASKPAAEPRRPPGRASALPASRSRRPARAGSR